MGLTISKSTADSSPEHRKLFECGKAYQEELKKTMKTLERLQEDYFRHKKLPFGLKENPEIDREQRALANRVVLSNLGGAGLSYLIARSVTRYDPRPKRMFIRFMATLTGGFIGMTWGVVSGYQKFARSYMEKSNWAPRLICPPIYKFKPCLEDYACRELLLKEPSGSVFAECYDICQHRSGLWDGNRMEAGVEGGEGDDRHDGEASSTDLPDPNDFVEPSFDDGSGNNEEGEGRGGGGWRDNSSNSTGFLEDGGENGGNKRGNDGRGGGRRGF